MSAVRYEILLPLQYNDGTPVEPEKFQETRRELIAKFGAMSMEPGSILGFWTYQGKEYEDELLRIILDVEDTSSIQNFFLKYKEILKERFDQVDIWITAYPIRIL